MSTMFEKVRAFHEAFALPFPNSPRVPPLAHRILRQRLIDEEDNEAAEEMIPTKGDGEVDLTAFVKEQCDAIYVHLGALVEAGVNADAAFSEVHRSNMSKLLPDGSVLRRADGKVLKGPNYSPADIESVLYPKES